MKVSPGRRRLEEAFAELKWRAYAKDPQLFFEECVFIPSQEDERGRTEFVLYDHQLEDLDTFLSNRFVVVLKARQLGLSTLVGGLSIWRCLFRPGSVILWVSNNQDNANKAVASLGVMWNFLPEWVKRRAPKLESDQAGKKEWLFPDGMMSRIRAFAGTATAGASETASIVVLDEFALVDGHLQDDLLRSAEPTTDAGGSLWMISTARGGHNRFAQTFRKAERGEAKFVSIFHPWMVSHFVNRKADLLASCQDCKGRGLRLVELDGRLVERLCSTCVDTSIYDSKVKEFEEKPWLIHAEYPATTEEAFRESGNPVFRDLPQDDELDTEWVRGFMREGELGPEFVIEPTGPLRIRPDILLKPDGPDPWRKYVLHVDPAEGVGGDYTAGTVLTWDDDALPDRVAWWHANDIEAVMAAREFNLLGRWFRNALLSVENTGGFGGSILTELSVHCRYPNLYSHRPSDSRRRTRTVKLGLPMSAHKRPMVVDRLLEFMRPDQRVGGIDPLLRQELGTFVRTEKGRLEADVGCHDDLVMSLAGALWVLVEETTATNPPSSERRDVDVRLKLVNSKARIEAALARQAEMEERWERRVSRRATARKRVTERRQQRRTRV